MNRRSRQRREVDLFNFSFLDILACVIGLLIFVLSIVVVSGGGSSNRQTGGRLANAELQLSQAKTAARMAADQLRLTEELLNKRAQDVANPEGAADAIRGQIRILEQEKLKLGVAAARSLAGLESLHKSLEQMGNIPLADPLSAEIQNELRQLDGQTAELISRAALLRAHSRGKARQVQYYVPLVREVHRSTLWVMASGDHFWCIESGDYSSDPINEKSTRFTRRAGAAGTSVTEMVHGNVAAPATLALAQPGETVLQVAVAPDGYQAFRSLRQWAWEKGFGVNWIPHEGDSIILTRTEHVFEQ